jgi:hypothetical protein
MGARGAGALLVHPGGSPALARTGLPVHSGECRLPSQARVTTERLVTVSDLSTPTVAVWYNTVMERHPAATHCIACNTNNEPLQTGMNRMMHFEL